ncbi:YajG family lipoprotein [Modicisalibacter radicis]|uniref:YajG family lipoprotein n=1 Tax=Halomonas sp. EAR18 TaxID=2518972 RepID=UPI00109D5FAA|nr:YajG family lipoprotein [Halomonas sp. EAR18]
MRIAKIARQVGGLAALGAALLLAGCAQSPQYLSVEPTVSSNLPQAGSGQAVTLTTADGRESDVLGTRSGKQMSTDTISVPAHTLMPKLQQQAEAALRQMGFEPTSQEAEGRPSLTLTLTQLSYQKGDAQAMLDKAMLVAKLQAVVENQGSVYTGIYTAKREQSYALTPDYEKNNQMVTELLSNALDRTFGDPQIGQLLAR